MGEDLYKENLKKLLIAWRKDNNLNQAQMADFIGIKDRTYQSIEATGDAVKIETLLKILTKLNIAPTQFFANSATNKEVAKEERQTEEINNLRGQIKIQKEKVEEKEAKINQLEQDRRMLTKALIDLTKKVPNYAHSTQ